MDIIKGKTWTFGENIDTDVIIANGDTNFFFGVICNMEIGNFCVCFIF